MRNIILKLFIKLGLLKRTDPGFPPELVVRDPIVSHPPDGQEAKIKLGLIVGHEKKSPGADLYGGGNEYVYNKSLAEYMRSIAAAYNLDCVVIFRDSVGIDGAYRRAFDLNCDCVIELHFNAFNKKARGTSTLTSTAAEDSVFAHAIHKAVLGVFGTDGRKDRGVKSLGRKDRGGRNVYSFNGMPNCLVEPAFGDNPQDAALLIDKKMEYGKAMLQAVSNWAKKNDMA